jgi:hypothetical protein
VKTGVYVFINAGDHETRKTIQSQTGYCIARVLNEIKVRALDQETIYLEIQISFEEWELTELYTVACIHVARVSVEPHVLCWLDIPTLI